MLQDASAQGESRNAHGLRADGSGKGHKPELSLARVGASDKQVTDPTRGTPSWRMSRRAGSRRRNQAGRAPTREPHRHVTNSQQQDAEQVTDKGAFSRYKRGEAVIGDRGLKFE